MWRGPQFWIISIRKSQDNIILAMFRSIFDAIADKISNLNPIRHFIKYALDKTLNQFLKKELSLQDFKNGPLNLHNIEINTEKINSVHLLGSPYVLHHGIIGHLKILLPPLSEISTQSIEISVSNIDVALKPNKNFAGNFKEKILELHELKKFYVEENELEGEISENGPVDFFKELLKKIIMNIKVSVNNVALKLYMNTPSEDQLHPQFYLMLRIPMIYLDRKDDNQKKNDQTEEIKFNILLPQVSAHLLREDMRFPDYSNLECRQEDYPFQFPRVCHPSTILLIGAPQVPLNLVEKIPQWKKDGSLKKMDFSNLGFLLLTDYKKKTKELNLSLDIQNFEIMANAVQLKILSRFGVQVIEFKKLLDSIMDELKFEASESVLGLKKKLSRQSSNGASQNNDLFSSIIMSLSGDMGTLSKKKSSEGHYIDSMLKEDRMLRESVREFNIQCEEKLHQVLAEKKSKEFSTGDQFRAIKFSESQLITMDLNSLRVYLLKHQSTQEFKRVWKAQLPASNINDKLGVSYFILNVTKANLQVKLKQKITQVSMKSLELSNVKLHSKKVNSTVDDYYDMRSSVDFDSMVSFQSESMSGNMRASSEGHQVPFNLPEIHQFELSESEHYCVEEIVKISQEESKPVVKTNICNRYSFLPLIDHPMREKQFVLYKPGLSIHLDKKQNYVKINVQIVTLSANLEIAKDLLNIIYPVFCYRRLADMIQYKRSQLDSSSPGISTARKNLLESQYELRVDVEEVGEETSSSNKNILVVEVCEIKLGLRRGKGSFENLVKGVKEKIYDQDSFVSDCFCEVNELGLYLEVYSIQFKKKMNQKKISCKNLEAGVMEIESSEIVKLSTLMKIKSSNQEDSIKFFMEEINYCDILSIFVPLVELKISEELTMRVSDLLLGLLKATESLRVYFRYLQNQMAMIEKMSGEVVRRNRKGEGSDKQLKIYVERISVEAFQYFKMELQKIYFNKQVQNGDIVVKVSTVVGALNRKLKPKIFELKNDSMLVNQYPANGKYPSISNSDIIFSINNSTNPNIPFKSLQKDAFFAKMDKAVFSLNLKVIKRDTDRASRKVSATKNTSFSQRFQFKNFNQSSIEEEGQNKIISLELSEPVVVYACNAIQMIQPLEKFKILLGKLQVKQKEGAEELRSQTAIMMERKHSAEIESETVEINLVTKGILVDVWPDFIRNEQKTQERIYGATRSVLSLELGETNITFRKDRDLIEIGTSVSLTCYFLQKEDRLVELNPILLPDEKSLPDLGFKNILEISKASIALRIQKRQIVLSLQVKSILAEASLRSLLLLQLHLEHVVKHHLQNNLGLSIEQIYDGDDFCELTVDEFVSEEESEKILIMGIESDEFEVEDLSSGVAVYQEKINLKRKEGQILKSRPIVYEATPDNFICFESIIVEKVIVRIGRGNDFDFIRTTGIDFSGVSRRSRSKEAEEARYLCLNLTNLYLKADLGVMGPGMLKPQVDIPIHVFCTMEKLKVSTCNLKGFGHSSLKRLETMIPQQIFMIFENEHEIGVIFEKEEERILIKSYALKMKLGLTSELVSYLKESKSISKEIERKGWKKIYEPPVAGEASKGKKMKERLLFLLPESSIKLSLQYENVMNILDEQIIITSELLINEELSNQYVIRNQVQKWMKKLIKNNIGSLVSRTALNLIIKLISQIIALNVSFIGKFLGLFIGPSASD